MNSKPQQIKMQSTKKGPLTKREEGGPSGGLAVGAALPGDEASSPGPGQPAAPSSLQPQVSGPLVALDRVAGKGVADWVEGTTGEPTHGEEHFHSLWHMGAI